ncbi:dTDP-4-dehydrorhamnose 3,5-epimerase [Chryseobacterium piperi]|uniref:dTDP-4-dehydrorhamnose 3,5-epimerase n=1 Tax=Chryseobacterium piperi TaxID=558152 RepID=A0A086BKA8_9FLAO|nr:dTDP-4-dehydrorhamnose 3,5-epimerase [Chryseobacterium piperi]ASW76151.1 dTDP-4-dehydrorhamnose 3,5-epimerase [Chryseobacterium piperi]KFF29372.1 dTDP-4-dehydrorhamnose 3,5-epimerase [Chryseobacterium piperi]
MRAKETKLKGCFILEPTVFEDERGYFFESYNEVKLEEILGYRPTFVQDNQSRSSYGVVRGLHMQAGEFAQAKLVRVIEGSVIDVVVDVRVGSPTYGESVAVELNTENKRQLFIPRGFLHGFSVISENATFFYKCDNIYNKASESGINPLDTELNIDWKIPVEQMIISEKDKDAQLFNYFRSIN